MKAINHDLLLSCIKENNYTVVGLAEKIGVSRNTIHNIMVGHTSPSHYTTASLIEALDLTHEILIAIFFPNRVNVGKKEEPPVEDERREHG